ncbi:hypothetical protein AAD018_009000 [Aestuariibius insulae]|uniref:hypothetical protein n=1 Tax=Aestuariibius insulae TaxID=2058287 RepID=UPI00345EDC4B
MTGSEIEAYLEDHLEARMSRMKDRIRALPTETAASVALQFASELTEFAAYELAGRCPSTTLSRLILTSAELERTAEDPSFNPHPSRETDPSRGLL